jgi:hypothetical protein
VSEPGDAADTTAVVPSEPAANSAPVREAIDCFSELVKHVEIVGVRLVGVEAKLHPWDGGLDDLHLRVDPPDFRATFDEEMRQLFCGIRFRFCEFSPSSDATLVSLVAEYDVVYSVPADVSVEETGAKLFAARNGVFNAWPFFRELVWSTVTRMGLDAAVVPLFRLGYAAPR